MKKVKKIYLSGKITGLSEKEYKQQFRWAEDEVRYQSGFGRIKIINPLNIVPFLGIRSWLCFMIADIFQLLKCDEIYMLKNWRDSRGARVELMVAILSKKKIKLQ